MKDVAGNEIHEGAILKVFHFVGKRNRIHYMYKQVGKLQENGYRKVYHLPIKSNPKTSNSYYALKESEQLKGALVIACYCEEHIHKDLKDHKFRVVKEAP